MKTMGTTRRRVRVTRLTNRGWSLLHLAMMRNRRHRHRRKIRKSESGSSDEEQRMELSK